MAKDIAIHVSGLGKQYRIGEGQGQYRTLRDSIASAVFRPVRAVRSLWAGGDNGRAAPHAIWALKDVSFEVECSEVVGIIGHNGAGKSTLLKVLSRITEPTEGYADIHGRVGSLLEVGTGFHPELTGRENIYLNGAILGMRRKEVERKFDEIVAFAEVEKFLDTPVKRYSSGMYMRLAFAVAANLDPDILVVDEVLAVGDVAFQKKCLGRMREVASHGRTVLFVSHNMEAVRRLCTRCILLSRGRITEDGDPGEVIERYFRPVGAGRKTEPTYVASSDVKSLTVEVDGRPADEAVWRTACPLRITIGVELKEPGSCPRVDIAFFRPDHLKVFSINGDRQIDLSGTDARHSWSLEFTIRDAGLAAQSLYMDVGVRRHDERYLGHWREACWITVVNDNPTAGVTADSIISPTIEVRDDTRPG
jgi:ABC-type polysaccharide/polyol phosphate transport system ATPase subunit